MQRRVCHQKASKVICASRRRRVSRFCHRQMIDEPTGIRRVTRKSSRAEAVHPGLNTSEGKLSAFVVIAHYRIPCNSSRFQTEAVAQSATTTATCFGLLLRL